MFAAKDVILNLIVANLESNFTHKNPTLKAFIIKDKENNYWIYDEMYKIKIFFLKEKILKLTEDLPGEQQIENCMLIIYSYKLDFKYHVLNDERFLESVILAYDFSIDFYQKRMSLTASKEKKDINENTDIKLFLQLFLRSMILKTLNTNLYEYNNTLRYDNMDNEINNNLSLKEENLHRDFGAFKISLFKDNCERIKNQFTNESIINETKVNNENSNTKSKSKSKSKNTKLSKKSCNSKISDSKSVLSLNKFNLEQKRIFLFNDNDEFIMPYTIIKLNTFDGIDENITDEYFSYDDKLIEDKIDLTELKDLSENDLIVISNLKNVGNINFNNFSLVHDILEEKDKNQTDKTEENMNKIKEFLKLKRFINIE